MPGSRSDGRRFIADAVARGAVAVLAEPGTEIPEGVIRIEDPAPRRAFALMAAAFHGRQPETVVAVTGTNGKTSTVQFARQLWERLGLPAAGRPGEFLVVPRGRQARRLLDHHHVVVHVDHPDVVGLR